MTKHPNLFFLILPLSLFISIAPATAEYRIWVGRNGSAVEAELISKTEETVELLKRDGNTVTVQISKLSDADQKYLRSDEMDANGDDHTLEETLKKLKSMHDDGLISKELYEKMKQDLLADKMKENQDGGTSMLPVDLKNGLVLYFGFNEPSSFEIKDESGYGNDGKRRGAEWVSDGHIGGAYRFVQKKRTHAIIVDDSDSLDCTEVTISVWIKTDDTGTGWSRIVDKDWKYGYNLCMGGSLEGEGKHHPRHGKTVFEFSYDRYIESASMVADDEWHHLVASYGNGYAHLYVDGEFDSEITGPNRSQLSVNNQDLVIGNKDPDWDGDSPYPFAFDGLIDEVRIYNRALDPDEVKALYQLGE